MPKVLLLFQTIALQVIASSTAAQPQEARAPHTSHLTHHTPHLTHHTSHTTHHTPHTTPHTPHLTPHTSHLTHHTSHLTHHSYADTDNSTPLRRELSETPDVGHGIGTWCFRSDGAVDIPPMTVSFRWWCCGCRVMMCCVLSDGVCSVSDGVCWLSAWCVWCS